jgi:hypothetical protein
VAVASGRELFVACCNRVPGRMQRMVLTSNKFVTMAAIRLIHAQRQQ